MNRPRRALLENTALLEHDLGCITPHADPELAQYCPHVACRILRGELTVNEGRRLLGIGPVKGVGTSMRGRLSAPGI